MTDTPDASKGLWVKCAACDHAWIATYYPAPVMQVVRITKGAVCPKCGDKHPVLAKQQDGVLLEAQS